MWMSVLFSRPLEWAVSLFFLFSSSHHQLSHSCPFVRWACLWCVCGCLLVCYSLHTLFLFFFAISLSSLSLSLSHFHCTNVRCVVWPGGHILTCLMTQPLPRVYHETRSERGETQVYAKRQSTKRKGEWTGPFLRVQKRESERGKVSLSHSLPDPSCVHCSMAILVYKHELSLFPLKFHEMFLPPPLCVSSHFVLQLTFLFCPSSLSTLFFFSLSQDGWMQHESRSLCETRRITLLVPLMRRYFTLFFLLSLCVFFLLSHTRCVCLRYCFTLSLRVTECKRKSRWRSCRWVTWFTKASFLIHERWLFHERGYNEEREKEEEESEVKVKVCVISNFRYLSLCCTLHTFIRSLVVHFTFT